LPDGSAVLCDDPEDVDGPDAWAVLEVRWEVTPDIAKVLMIESLTDVGRN
jgi:hypothetical protein